MIMYGKIGDEVTVAYFRVYYSGMCLVALKMTEARNGYRPNINQMHQ
jgi:hypothetical protein